MGSFFMSRFTSLRSVITGFMLAVILGAGLAQAKVSVTAEPAVTISVSDLPRQGALVYGLIRKGGPFAHEKDGIIFGNRERLLPFQKRGYYREYTVAEPGANNRGVRRIVCGGQPRAPDICYYTADHYASFRKIVP
jgi:ribonuclease T1